MIIPVKYDFGELWRWSVILNRFAVSAGNTVGITAGRVVLNVAGNAYAGPGTGAGCLVERRGRAGNAERFALCLELGYSP